MHKKFFLLIPLLTVSSCSFPTSETSNPPSTISGTSSSEESSNSISDSQSGDTSSTSELSEGKYVDNINNIDLQTYGNKISAQFYIPALGNDPYADVDVEQFYENYQPAGSYEDSYFRSVHHLLSGENVELSGYYEPIINQIDDEISYRVQNGRYILDVNGNYLAYYLNSATDVDNKGQSSTHVIYYGGAYTSMEEVAAYLYAFGEVPANSDYDKGKSGQTQSISDWGVYGRVNTDYFSGDTGSYPYEPVLPELNYVSYTETDFGTTGYFMNSWSSNYTDDPYNSGYKITRGAARFIFGSNTSDSKNIDERHVFYTYNHYNDMQEYLNYENGWGLRFGSQSAGNEYVAGSNDWYDYENHYGVAPNEPTEYPGYSFVDFKDL